METSNQNHLTIGVIGGMGPAATLDLFAKIISLTPVACDEDHLNIQIDNNPVPGAKRDPLCERAKRLEVCGVDFIVIPCNAAHEHHAAIQASVKIPVVNMIRETVETVTRLEPGVQHTAVLAWHETLSAGLYQKMLQEYGIQPVLPAQSDWPLLTRLINAVKSGDGSKEKPAVRELGTRLIDQGAQAIILGCTELPLVFSQKDFSVPVIDATHILACTAVNLALRKTPFRKEMIEFS